MNWIRAPVAAQRTCIHPARVRRNCEADEGVTPSQYYDVFLGSFSGWAQRPGTSACSHLRFRLGPACSVKTEWPYCISVQTIQTDGNLRARQVMGLQ